MPNFESWFFKYNGWSYSKHRLFNLCKRCFYYRYIGTALKESNDFDIYKLKYLKAFNSKNALEGLLIHDVIEKQIGKHHIGDKLDEAEANSQFVRQLEKYRNNAHDTLIEFYNGLPYDDAFFDQIRESGQEKISTFFEIIWPQVKDLEYLKHEDFDKFSINDVEIIVKVDYVSKTKNDIIVVVDWKTGADNMDNESDLQIGTYVLWAMQYYQKSMKEIHSELAYLKTGTIQSYKFSLDDLKKIQGTILQDFKNMNNSYEISDFPSSPEPFKCLSCQFGSICPDSQVDDYLNKFI